MIDEIEWKFLNQYLMSNICQNCGEYLKREGWYSFPSEDGMLIKTEKKQYLNECRCGHHNNLTMLGYRKEFFLFPDITHDNTQKLLFHTLKKHCKYLVKANDAFSLCNKTGCICRYANCNATKIFDRCLAKSRSEKEDRKKSPFF